MTFAAMGRCPRTGQIGATLTSYSVNAGRVTPRYHGLIPVYRAAGAIVMSHAFGNPQLTHDVFAMLEAGFDLARVERELPAKDPFFEYRQLNVLTGDGRMWVRTGQNCSQYAGQVIGEGWAVSGNMLIGQSVVQAMAEAMAQSEDEQLAERLLRTLEAGRDAGGQSERNTHQHVPELSSVLLVVDGKHPYPKVDIRVDYHPEAVDQLRALYEYTKPLDAYYEGLRFHPDRLDEFLDEQGVSRMPHFDLSKTHHLR